VTDPTKSSTVEPPAKSAPTPVPRPGGAPSRLPGAAMPDRLPAPVRAALHDQQRSSEILIGWVQLSVVVAFGLLYLISPKTYPEEAEFLPIPWVLGAYAAFTLCRLVLAYRIELPPWLLGLSVVVDMALLLVTIWSFHEQYMQPAAFYLKAPTLLYVFIFIALRTLRFEPYLVALSGVVAAVGWLMMVVYAVSLDPAAAPITRDYVYYLTSNTVLLGAEFDKVISILTVTAILVVAIVRARRLLVRSVTDGLAARELSRYLDRDVAARIAGLDIELAAGQGTIREAAVLNVDIRGFSRLADELSPAEVMEILADYQARVVPVISRHGGSIDKFLGDGILATFGATGANPTAAADALRATDDVAEVLRVWQRDRAATAKPAPGFGCAVAAGRVVFGAVGDQSRLEVTVIGQPVNLAARLEKQTKVEAVTALTDSDTYDLGVAQGYRRGAAPERRAGRSVSGVEQPVDLVVLAR